MHGAFSLKYRSLDPREALVAKIWKWARDPLNLAVLVALAGAISFIWTNAVAPLLSSGQANPTPAGQTAIANGGTAINARDAAVVGSSQGSGTGQQTSSSEVLPQKAEAAAGGRAINAQGSAKITIGSPASIDTR